MSSARSPCSSKGYLPIHPHSAKFHVMTRCTNCWNERCCPIVTRRQCSCALGYQVFIGTLYTICSLLVLTKHDCQHGCCNHQVWSCLKQPCEVRPIQVSMHISSTHMKATGCKRLTRSSTTDVAVPFSMQLSFGSKCRRCICIESRVESNVTY